MTNKDLSGQHIDFSVRDTEIGKWSAVFVMTAPSPQINSFYRLEICS